MTSTQQRADFANMVFNGAYNIVRRTNNEEAKKVWDYVIAHGCLVEPIPGSPGGMSFNVLACLKTQLPPESNSDLPTSPLYILPLYQADGALDPILKAHWDYDYANAIYEPQFNLITLHTSNEDSPFVMGCRLLHEGNHGLRAFQEKRVGQRNSHWSEPSSLHEEIAVQTIDQQLWREPNPVLYDQVINAMVYRITKQWRRQTNQKNATVTLPPDYSLLAQLEPTLGQAPSQERLNSRWHKLKIHAMFTFIDREYPNPLAAKAEFMRLDREQDEVEHRKKQVTK